MNGPSRRVILVCEECGERTVLGEPLSVWCSSTTHFGCECGRQLTLADRLAQQRISRVEDVANVAALPSPLHR